MARRTISLSRCALTGCPLREPTIEKLLSDPLIRTIMEADGVDLTELKAMMRRLAGLCRGHLLAAPEPARGSSGSQPCKGRGRRFRRQPPGC